MSVSSRKTALVTGAATGVGRATAIRFAMQGFDVVVNYLGPDEADAALTKVEIESHNARAILERCDVGHDKSVRDMAASVESTFGRLDVLVNCAGVTHFVEHSDLDAMTEAKWDQILAVNTKGPFFTSRAFAPLLKRSGDGAIVNVSSVAGVSGNGSCIAYCASKGALNTMTKSLARALAPEIRVNAVCPGPIDSGWLRQGMTDDQMANRVASFPIPRLAQPKDIVDAILYLATGTSLTTGQLLIVDGGRTM
ncbi:SDR family oxidoreductase [bacterium]|jgi:3-oxoacyl-[acyl-carrier protein] reductase|nr:SDR family oxidoreductase [bacterium]